MEARKLDTNPSGISPRGNRVIVRPDEVEQEIGEDLGNGKRLVLPQSEKDKYAGAQSLGVLVAVGPDAWTHAVKEVERLIDGQWKLVERVRSGYSEDFAKVGDRVAFAKFGGQQADGEDGVQYRLLNDEDITAVVSDRVSFTGLRAREPVGGQG